MWVYLSESQHLGWESLIYINASQQVGHWHLLLCHQNLCYSGERIANYQTLRITDLDYLQSNCWPSVCYAGTYEGYLSRVVCIRIRLKFHDICKTFGNLRNFLQSNNYLFCLDILSDKFLMENECYFICLGLEKDNQQKLVANSQLFMLICP